MHWPWYLPIFGNCFVYLPIRTCHFFWNLIWSVCLWPCNHEKIKKWQHSIWRRTAIHRLQMQCKSCRGIFDRTASYSLIHQLAQGTGFADPSNMANFTFQRHGYRDISGLDTLGETFGILILIILNCSHRKNEKTLEKWHMINPSISFSCSRFNYSSRLNQNNRE